MFKFLKKLIMGPIVSLRWVKSLSLSAQGEYENALQYLDKIEGYFLKDAEYHALKGFLYYAVLKDKLAIENLELSFQLIEKSARYSRVEKKYLRCYVSTWLGKAKTGRGHADEMAIRPECGKLDLSSVASHLKKNFPLRDHPDWNKAGLE